MPSQTFQRSSPDGLATESRKGSATSKRLIDLVTAHDFADLPGDVVAAAKMFLADTLAVGVAGSGQNGAARIMTALSHGGGNCGILGRPGERCRLMMPPCSTAFRFTVSNGMGCTSIRW